MSDQELRVEKTGDRGSHAERWFDAPRDQVWRAFTDRELIEQWWGPHGTTTVVDKLELEPGGAWRFVQRMEDGTETGFHGEFREIEEPERITWTFEWEGMPGHVAVDSTTFTEQDGGTLVTTVSTFESQEDRDGMFESGMEDGMRETYDRLADLLAKVTSG
jgi:uncharacterized protein YndB with AHSA1/START domain